MVRLGDRICAQLELAATRVSREGLLQRSGRVTRASGLVIEAAGLKLAVGTLCQIDLGQGSHVLAEVVGFRADTLYLMPQGDTSGLPQDAKVTVADTAQSIPVPLPLDGSVPVESPALRGRALPVGWGMLGRVVDANGVALDGKGAFKDSQNATLSAKPINPMLRDPVNGVLDVGVRAINGLLTVGKGQRMGLFAGSGVGKSVLLGMMAKFTQADVVVVGLIGERGREVKEFIEHNLGPEGLARSVVVAAPADAPPLMRLQGAVYSTRLAEFFRDEGKNVLLIMDSLTRYAMAQREIALAVGEAPATKGYPPSVFAKLPALVERAGNGEAVNGNKAGSITAFYTVLTEGDDQQDPIADSARAILDGHIVLSRSLAESGHYPAIDIEASISRVMQNITEKSHFGYANHFKQLYSIYQRNRDLVAVDLYKAGTDPKIDAAMTKYPFLEQYLQQGIDQNVNHQQSLVELSRVMGA